ncbi:hypothetical protein, partial [Klebsiella pneumoniae]|uniref:hypothetical protein n=1 Tax=Klebsiella pneumoniae TaxID=573 RepID=UPI001C8F257B
IARTDMSTDQLRKQLRRELHVLPDSSNLIQHISLATELTLIENKLSLTEELISSVSDEENTGKTNKIEAKLSHITTRLNNLPLLFQPDDPQSVIISKLNILLGLQQK